MSIIIILVGMLMVIMGVSLLCSSVLAAERIRLPKPETFIITGIMMRQFEWIEDIRLLYGNDQRGERVD